MKFSQFQAYKPKIFTNVTVFVCEDDFLVWESRPVWARILGGSWVFEKFQLKEFEQFDGARLMEEALTPSLFSQSRVILVSGAEKMSKARIADMSALQKVSESSLKVILICSDRAAESLEKVFPVIAIDPLTPAENTKWLIDRYGLTADVARYIVESAEPDLHVLHNEMEKLKTYVGEGRAIEIADVNASVLRAEKFGPFELDDAILAKDYKRAVDVVGAMLDEGMEPLVILARIIRVWRQLLIGKGMAGKGGARDVAAAAGVPAFKAAEFVAGCRKYPWHRLAAGFRHLLDADRALKTSAPSVEAYFDIMLWKLVA